MRIAIEKQIIYQDIRRMRTGGVTGIKTAGFWSRWVLWNLPTLQASISDVNKRVNINVKLI